MEREGVTDYRVYRLNEHGRIAGAGDDIACSCDNEALSHAQQMAEHCPAVEVWQNTRCVGRVGAAGADVGARPGARRSAVIIHLSSIQRGGGPSRQREAVR